MIPDFLTPNEPGRTHRHALALTIDSVALPERFQGDAAAAVAAMNAEVAAAVAAVDELHAAMQAKALEHAPKLTELNQLIDRLQDQADQYRKQISQAKQPQPESVADMRIQLHLQARLIGGATDAELLADAADTDSLRILSETARVCRREALQEAAQARLIELLTDHAPGKLQAVESQISELVAVRDRCAAGYRRAVESIGPRGRKVER